MDSVVDFSAAGAEVGSSSVSFMRVDVFAVTVTENLEDSPTSDPVLRLDSVVEVVADPVEESSLRERLVCVISIFDYVARCLKISSSFIMQIKTNDFVDHAT